MKTPIFTGAATALITPLTAEGVDYEALGRLIDWQIDSGIDALVICGTTGEAPTLSDAEKIEIFRRDFPISNSDICRRFSVKEGAAEHWCFTRIGAKLLAIKIFPHRH